MEEKIEKESEKKEFLVKNVSSALIGLKTKVVKNPGDCSNKECGLFEDITGRSNKDGLKTIDANGSENVYVRDSSPQLVTPTPDLSKSVHFETNTSSSAFLPDLFKVTWVSII